MSNISRKFILTVNSFTGVACIKLKNEKPILIAIGIISDVVYVAKMSDLVWIQAYIYYSNL